MSISCVKTKCRIQVQSGTLVKKKIIFEPVIYLNFIKAVQAICFCPCLMKTGEVGSTLITFTHLRFISDSLEHPPPPHGINVALPHKYPIAIGLQNLPTYTEPWCLNSGLNRDATSGRKNYVFYISAGSPICSSIDLNLFSMQLQQFLVWIC